MNCYMCQSIIQQTKMTNVLNNVFPQYMNMNGLVEWLEYTFYLSKAKLSFRIFVKCKKHTIYIVL